MTVLAIAMLIPVAVTLALSLRIASRMLEAGLRPARRDSPPRDSRSDDGSRRADLRSVRSRHSAATSGRSARASCCRRSISASTSSWSQLWSGTESVALYNAVFRLVEALRLFPAAVLAVMLPSLVRAGDLRPLARVAVPVTAFAIAATGVLWIAAGWLIPLALRRALRGCGAGVSRAAAVVSAACR